MEFHGLRVTVGLALDRGGKNGSENVPCLHHFLVLVNGFPNHLFKVVRGLRQGDPMFPLIFMIVSKALGAPLSRQWTLGLLRVLRWLIWGGFYSPLVCK